MGCQFSQTLYTRRGSNSERRNTIVLKPSAAVRVGTGIRLGDQKGTKIVFIFGGPGSGKGTIINNLMEMYNFRFVCGEDLMLEQLSKKLLPEGCTGTTATMELQKLLSTDSSQLTLEWVLELIGDEISRKHSGKTVIIDMVPNLKFLLKAPHLVKECRTEMREFEKEHPVAFAINLSLDQRNLLQNINITHACTKPPEQDKAKDGEQNSDEMDTSRTQRRFSIYINSVKPFLKYFADDDKLLTVDTSCGRIDSVWDSLKDFVIESELANPLKCIEQVIIFKMDEEDFIEIDQDRYPMLTIRCKDLMEDYKTAEPDKLMKKLYVHLSSQAARWKAFLVDAVGTKLCVPADLKSYNQQALIFLEDDAGQLDFFIHGLQRKTQRKKSYNRKLAQKYKTIATGDNEALVFPTSCDTEHCHQIGMCYLKVK